MIADPVSIAREGNNGELRSAEHGKPQGGFLALLFGGEASAPSMLPQTRALDAVLEKRQSQKKFKVKSEFEPQTVPFSGYERGTIVIDTSVALPLSGRNLQHRPPLRDRGRPRGAGVQGHRQGRRQAGMAALDPDPGHAEARAARSTASTRTA